MAHHLFKDIAILVHVSNDSFYGTCGTPIEVPCVRETDTRRLILSGTEEVQLRARYLFSSDVDINDGDTLDGYKVKNVAPLRGITSIYKEVLTYDG